MKFSYLSLLAFVSSALSQNQILHPNADRNVCLDVKDGNFVNGTTLQIWPCNKTPAQQWKFITGPTSIHLGDTGFCLDATSANPSNGTPMRIWACDNTPKQQWLSAAGPIGGIIKLADTNVCIDVDSSNHAPGTVVRAWECLAGVMDQIWTAEPQVV